MKKVFLMIFIFVMTCNLFAHNETIMGGGILTIVSGKTAKNVQLDGCSGEGDLHLVDSKGDIVFKGVLANNHLTVSGLSSGSYVVILTNGSCTSSTMVEL